jgi:hypothetical protein
VLLVTVVLFHLRSLVIAIDLSTSLSGGSREEFYAKFSLQLEHLSRK